MQLNCRISIRPGLALLLAALTLPGGAQERINSTFPSVDLRAAVRPTALRDMAAGPIWIDGHVRLPQRGSVAIRVTTGAGRSSTAVFPAKDGLFHVAYPRDFPAAPPLDASVLFVDAVAGSIFDLSHAAAKPAEATLIVYDSRRHLVPDFPSAFTTNLRDRRGRKDANSAEWPAMRALVNLYMQSYGARLAGVGRQGFDLEHPADFAWFKDNLALYDFAHRDRDWSRPLGHRAARTLWQSVWNRWFNAGNDHPLDGNPSNTAPSNYMPYAFTNDLADILIEHLLRQHRHGTTEDDLAEMCRDATLNLLALQHREPTNFALPDRNGRRETYTAGAFHYGLFDNGDYLTEGKGWFYNPAFRDYAGGGVLNGRAVWAIGEALRSRPDTGLRARLQEALALAIRFCLSDALKTGYAHTTAQGRTYWRDAGEHAYLALGMVDVCAVAPGMIVERPKGKLPVTLADASAEALDALLDLRTSRDQWAVYPNVDSMAITALAEGAITLPQHPHATRWREAAELAARGWMAAKVDRAEFQGPVVHFGLRLAPDTMTYRWARLDPKGWQDRNYIFFYQSGHWIHALSRLYALTGHNEYRARAEAIASYLCGDNPWGVRLLNEMGGVYNWVEDRDGDGIEDALRQDMYPESTAFTHIGLAFLLRTLAAGHAP